jgi:hypothetical protein
MILAIGDAIRPSVLVQQRLYVAQRILGGLSGYPRCTLPFFSVSGIFMMRTT